MLRFTIRDLLWLTLLAAFAVAWHVDRTRLLNVRQALERRKAALAQELETKRRLAFIENAVRQLEREREADEAFESRMLSQRLDDATARYLQAVRNPQNGYHYPIIWRDEARP